MPTRFSQVLDRIDWWLVSAALALTGFGLLLIHSLTWPQDSRFIKQLIFLGVGVLVMFSLQFAGMHFFRNASVVFYISMLVLLVGLLLFAGEIRGTRGWISFGPIGFQPAEFTKLAVILFLTEILSRMRFDIARGSDVLLLLLAAGIPFALIALQPDLGSAFIIAVTSGAMILYAGLDKKKFIALLLLGMALGSITWFAGIAPYQKERVLTFLNPQSDPLGSGYNVTQSIVAIGSGGFFGRGLGLGTQSQLNFLPEQETDFIFASTAEELGFLGAAMLMAVYLFFLFRLWRCASSAGTRAGNFISFGIVVMFLAQAVVNIGMNMGLFPVTGVTLPFVSYGGSSLVASFAGIGIAMSTKSS